MTKYLILFLLAGSAYAAEPCDIDAMDGYFVQPQAERDRAMENWKKFQKEHEEIKKDNQMLNNDLATAQDTINRLHKALEKAQEAAASTTVVESKNRANHRIAAYLGRGPSGLDIDRNGNSLDIDTQTDTVGGVSYGYLFSDKWSINALLMSGFKPTKRKTTGAVGLGYDF